MECHKCMELLGAYGDGELELSASLEIEKHLQDCVMCARAVRMQRVISEKLKDPGLRYTAGTALRDRVAILVRQQQTLDAPALRHNSAIPPSIPLIQPRIRFWRTLAIAAMVALVATVAFTTYRELGNKPMNAMLASDVLAGHVRSLMATHMLDVISTDQHTVKPWFAGKLDFSPQVQDLKEDGFPLIGGRLDYLHGRSVAALVFQRRKHVINLFTWPLGKSEDIGAGQYDQAGYHVRSWNIAGMTYWAVSDVNAGDLDDFVKLYRDRITR